MDPVYYLCFVCICHTVFSVPCSLLITCLERADFLSILYLYFLVFFVIFPYGVLGQVWYFIVSIPDICLFPYCYKL